MIPVLAALLAFSPQVLQVGDGKPFARIEDAVKAASAGDTVEVFSRAEGYSRTAVLVRTPRLTIVGRGSGRILVSGAGFDYSGSGSVPRALFQFDPAADGCVLEHFELTGAHNESSNGAGVRINSAKDVTVRDCDVHGNDMGVMSNGITGDVSAGSGQTFERCHVHHNGTLKDPGYNHNFYLGGTSATLQFCEVDHSLTGHNVKSRAHYTVIEYCHVHDSANREFDFVEAWDTERPHSNAVLLGNVVAKDPDCPGNRGVVHFGREKGTRSGTLFLVNNTFVTPFASAVLALTSPGSTAVATNNVFVNTVQSAPVWASWSGGAAPPRGLSNWLSSGYALDGTGLDERANYRGSRGTEGPGFDGDTYVLSRQPPLWRPAQAAYEDGNGATQTARPVYRYVGGGRWSATTASFLGAG